MIKRLVYPLYYWITALIRCGSQRLTPGGMLVFWSIILAAIVGIDTTYTMAYQVLALLVALLLFSAACGWFSRGKYTVRRDLPRVGSAGLPLPYCIYVSNLSERPQRGLEIEEVLADHRPSLQHFLNQPEPGETRRNWFDQALGYYRWRWLLASNIRAVTPRLLLPVLAPASTTVVHHHLHPHRRGWLQLRQLVIAWPDPLGLFRGLRALPCEQRVLILPRRYSLPALQLPGHRQHQPGGVALASSVGESEEFVSLRDYRPGDPLRRIHWRSLARTGKPIIKEFQDEYFVRHALILDTFRQEADNVFEEAVSVAASFACTIPDQESLLDLLFAGPSAVVFTAGRSLGHAEKMLEVLAGVQPVSPTGFPELEQLVIRHAAMATSCICVLVDWNEPRKRLVERLRRMGLSVMVLVVRPAGTGDIPLDHGPAEPGQFHPLEVGRIAEGLAKI